jgi:ElaB/YqjD/DUF883 family membrane-anchored ribosome-binding protein
MYSRQDLEDIEEQAYCRGYSDCEVCVKFVRSKQWMIITHTIAAVVAFIIGVLFHGI